MNGIYGWPNGILFVFTVFAASYIHFCRESSRSDSIVSVQSPHQIQSQNPLTPDTTAIILNWSRLPNVIRIVSLICNNLLEDTITSVFIYNNSPHNLVHEDFEAARCPREKLRIHNSPVNLYFEARYLACAQSSTRFCFIQDDDFLVRPEIIRALRLRMLESSVDTIHLQPPHEMLVSQLRTVHVSDKIHTTFAWLGYGTMVTQVQVVRFLSVLELLHLDAAERQMADNYFTILGNKIPELWFDHNLELGGGQPFTVGSEGIQRNNEHIQRAARLLDAAITTTIHGNSSLPYISHGTTPKKPLISRSPCLEKVCLFETSIALLPDGLNYTVSGAEDILQLEVENLRRISAEAREHYLLYPPSFAVDQKPDTFFRSTDCAKADDWISLTVYKVNRPIMMFELVILVDHSTQGILRACLFETSADGRHWIKTDTPLLCAPLDFVNGLWECKILMTIDMTLPSLQRHTVGYLRARLLQSMEERWTIHEMLAIDKFVT